MKKTKDQKAVSKEADKAEDTKSVLKETLTKIQEESQKHTRQQQETLQQLATDMDETYERIQQNVHDREQAQNSVTNELLESIRERFKSDDEQRESILKA